MKQISFSGAIEQSLVKIMKQDPDVIILGEDVCTLRRNLLAQFGPGRVLNTPISESAFLGAAIFAALGGLKPIVEIMLIDFIGVCMDGLLNQASKIEFFSGGKWKVPLVIRASCGGGYGDGGQHEQSLWGWLAYIPGLCVVVPSSPGDAGSLMYSAIKHDGPVVFLEHKLLSDYWLEYMGGASRDTVTFDVPAAGTFGEVPENWTGVPLGKAKIVRPGKDVSLISLGIGVHRCLSAAQDLAADGIDAQVIDLRTVSPLDEVLIIEAVKTTGKCIVVDEDYESFGLSGEIAALLSEKDVPFRFRRVCTQTSIPYSRKKEDEALPNVAAIIHAVKMLFE